ncbi:MAG: tetratricopeptide repeat protein [Leptonema sp. (in: bacteria)]
MGRIVLILFFFIFNESWRLNSKDQTIYIYAFESYKSVYPKKTILVGEIKSKVKVAEILDKQSPIKEYDTRKDQVTVKVINKKGLKVGQNLYVVHKDPHHEKFKNAYIVGEITVNSILNHPFYGLVLTGTGNLLRVREGLFVVRTLDSENIEAAYLLKRKADNYFFDGEYEKAIQEYQKAIQKDSALVEAYFALGKLYWTLYNKGNQSIDLLNSLQQFRIAWKHKDLFRYNLEYFEYLNYYFSSLLEYFLQEKYKKPKESVILQSLIELKNISEECEKISNSIECKMAKSISLYYLMNFYSGETNKEERSKYDFYKQETGLQLKSIEEEMFKENYKKFKDYTESKVKEINSNIDIIQYEYVFIKYYYQLYSELNSIEKYKEKQRLKELLIKHANLYFTFTKDKQKYHNQNLEILEILNSFR